MSMGMIVQPPDEMAPRPYPRTDAPDESAVSPKLVFSILFRRKFSVLFAALLLSGLSIAGSQTLKRNFVATASVLMQERKTSVSNILEAGGSIGTDSIAVRTQVDILKSDDLARSIVRKLQLINLPEFSPHEGLLAAMLDRLRSADRFGVLARLGLGQPPAPPPMPLPEREELAAQILLGMTTIVNDGKSYVIDIKVKASAATAEQNGHAAELAETLANAYADAYVQLTGRMKSDSIRQANSFFDERINTLKEKMRIAEDAVETYRAANGLEEDRVASSDAHTVTLASQQMAQLNGVLVTAAAERAKMEASLEQIGLARLGKGNLEAVPEVVESPLIHGLREQQAQLGAREAALAMNHGSGSPELAEVRASQRDVARQITEETQKIAASLRSSVAAAQVRETWLRGTLAQLQKQVGVQGQSGVKLHELQNEADVARAIYSTYLKRFEETANQIDLQDPDAVVVSHAAMPLGPAPPSRSQVMIIGIVLSCILAGLQALVRERLRSGFRSSMQLEAKVGVETFGLLPKVRDPHASLRFDDRHSAFSEAVYSIRAMLRQQARHGLSQVVMVTSAIPKEGKTFFSSALARNAAVAGERVVLIDCDVRRPAVARNIGGDQTHSLGDVVIRQDSHSPLHIIALTPGLQSPHDLFASAFMRKMIAMLRKHYDLILLDTPPVLAVSDARVLAVLSDITILVVRWQTTPQNLVTSAVKALRGSGAVLAGTVINQIKFGSMDAVDDAQAYVYRTYARDYSKQV